jgi:hypothetical protein
MAIYAFNGSKQKLPLMHPQCSGWTKSIAYPAIYAAARIDMPIPENGTMLKVNFFTGQNLHLGHGFYQVLPLNGQVCR